MGVGSINNDAYYTDSRFHPFSSQSKRKINDGSEGHLPQFQDTVPLDRTLAGIPPQNLYVDTELVDDSESDKNTCFSLPCDYLDEMVLDSEDEEVNGSRVVKITNRTHKEIEKFALDLDSTHREPSLPFGIAKAKVENTCASTEGKCSTGNEVSSANIWNGNGEKEKDQPAISACDCQPILLNYTRSEEPHELSQAEALCFVDHFVSTNSLELSEETGHRGTSREKSPPVSSITGSQSLARKLHNQTEEMVDFDWVDDYPQRKVLKYFRKKRRYVVKHQGAGQGYDKECFGLDNECKEESRISSPHEQVTCSSYLHSRLVEARGNYGSEAVKITKMNNEVNPTNELESQHDADVTKMHFETSPVRTDTLDAYEIGFNTQIAAEAMEALASGTPDGCIFADSYPGKVNANDSLSSGTENEDHLKHLSPEKSVCHDIRDILRNAKRRKRSAMQFKVTCSSSNKQSEIKKFVPELVTTKQVIRSQFANNHPSCTSSAYKSEVTGTGHLEPNKQKKVEGALLQNNCGVSVNVTSPSASVEHSSFKKANLLGQCISPLADQIGRDRTKINPDKSNGAEDISISSMGQDNLEYKRKQGSMHTNKLNMPQLRRKCSNEGTLNMKFSISSKLSTWSYPKGKRTRPQAQNHSNSDCDVNSNRKDISLQERISSNNDVNWKNESSSCGSPGQLSNSSTNLHNFYTSASFICERSITNMKTSYDISSLNYMSHGYLKKPCNTTTPKSSLLKELIRLGVPKSLPCFTSMDLRRRKDMAHVRVLFSQHLDADIIKQQKKIAPRLGITIASCSVDATHFVADKFARTRNMLEAIALGKPVVTHLWLESCGQASCFIDEKNYILRDTKKEKEIGFSMPLSLARANQHPLLEGKKVFITTNIKPDKEMITDLVKAVSGLPLEEENLTALEDEKVVHEMLILSCNEDQAVCMPFLKKGASVYSSEFLLNGIVTQKLEYERYQLFTEVA